MCIFTLYFTFSCNMRTQVHISMNLIPRSNFNIRTLENCILWKLGTQPHRYPSNYIDTQFSIIQALASSFSSRKDILTVQNLYFVHCLFWGPPYLGSYEVLRYPCIGYQDVPPSPTTAWVGGALQAQLRTSACGGLGGSTGVPPWHPGCPPQTWWPLSIWGCSPCWCRSSWRRGTGWFWRRP